MRASTIAALGIGLAWAVSALAQQPGIERTPAPEGAQVYFISPQHGATLENPVTIRFGLRDIGVAPAGIDSKNTGHHHLLIDLDSPPDFGLPLPATEQVRHFGSGQTEVTLDLPPGEHRLQLLLGDYRHVPHDPPILSQTITVTVLD